jgi:hypothetical protein
MSKEFYSRIANLFVAHENCVKSGNKEYEDRHANNLEDLVKNYLPRGSGFDAGTKFIWEESNRNKLVFATSFNHMNEGGYYDGWTDHKVIVTPDLLFGYNIKITGRNRNDIKEYIHSRFHDFDYKQ